MPLSYGDGTLAEHRACRDGAVVFDVSHLGTVRVEGEGAVEVCQRAFTNDLGRIGPGRAQYTHLLNPADASVTDDIIVWWRRDGALDVMPNASNTDGVTSALAEEAANLGEERVTISDVTSSRAILAVQGPDARRRLATISPEAAAVSRFAVVDVSVAGVSCVVAGTGYTGEDGVEIAVPAEDAAILWETLTAAGITPAGLGARDTLRLEAGLPLHGHELGEGITSLQAGLGWVVRWDKGDFRGRSALEEERDRGPSRQLVGLVAADRRPPRQGDTVLRDGIVAGEVTSGNFSPALGVGIALAFITGGAEEGSTLTLSGRGPERAVKVVVPPFVP